MLKRFVILLFLLPLFSFSGLHKFYVSVTDIEYNPETEALQIISRVFTDDMENLLRMRYSDDLRLNKEAEHANADAFLEKYLLEKLEVKVNGKPYRIHYLGKKYDLDQLVIFLEVEQVDRPWKVSVINEVLFDAFPDQKNVVNVEIREDIKSMLLTRDRESGVVNFDD